MSTSPLNLTLYNSTWTWLSIIGQILQLYLAGNSNSPLQLYISLTSTLQSQNQSLISHRVCLDNIRIYKPGSIIIPVQIFFRSKVLRHNFYLPKVIIQVQTGLEYQFHAFKTWSQPVEYSIAILDLHHYLRYTANPSL